MEIKEAMTALSSVDQKKLQDQSYLLELSEALVLLSEAPDVDWEIIWRGLFCMSESQSIDYQDVLELCGWQIICTGIQVGIMESRVIDTLFQFASLEFPESVLEQIFSRDDVKEAIQAGLQANPQAFINQADLGGAEPLVQSLFMELLEFIFSLSDYPTLCLQWAACGLRVLPENSSFYERNAIVLLGTLLERKRPVSAYYCLRGMVEKKDALWNIPILSQIISAYVRFCSQKPTASSDLALRDLIIDEAILRHCSGTMNLLSLIGPIGMYLYQQRRIEEAHTVCWLFISNVHESYPVLSTVFSNYFLSMELPEIPPSKSKQLSGWKAQLDEKIESAQHQLHPRTYSYYLASAVYTDNVKRIFEPFLNIIKEEKCDLNTLEQIRELDTKSLIDKSPLNMNSTNPIEGSLRLKMIEHNQRIKDALLAAAEMNLEFKHKKRTREINEADQVFEEFKIFTMELDMEAKWVWQTYLPELWNHLQNGLKILES